MTKLNEDFQKEILLYGAAKAMHSSATSDQKRILQNQIEDHKRRALEMFNKEFVHATKVIHKQNTKDFSSFSLPGAGTTPVMKFSYVGEELLNPIFNDKYPNYPSFKRLPKPITKDNFDVMVKNALKKILSPGQPNSDGEAILEGLGVWNSDRVELDHSKYVSHYRSE